MDHNPMGSNPDEEIITDDNHQIDSVIGKTKNAVDESVNEDLNSMISDDQASEKTLFGGPEGVVLDGSTLSEEIESLEGRVLDIHEPSADIILPSEPSRLEGEVRLVRRVDPDEKDSPSGYHVKRVTPGGKSGTGDDGSHGFLYSMMDTIRYVSLGLLIGILLVVFVVQRNDVYGGSMEPTLYDRDAVFVEMISVYLGNYERGDIITIKAEGMEGFYFKENIIKRVIGMPGETVSIIDGQVYINDKLLIEPYLSEGIMTYVSSDGVAKGYDRITLGPGEYYCLGDNRGASNDSRRLGPIPESRIKSHVIARIFPFDTMEIF
ncbi:MAG: signal peptidase I [Clostridiaceae bacterium]|nr:signal peptidase I [Clostridiaceae bacterium]